MNRLNAKARITEVDGLSDSIVRIFGADLQAQEDAFCLERCDYAGYSSGQGALEA